MAPGLFGVPALTQPRAFRDLADSAMGQCGALLHLLSVTQQSTESLRLIDQISDQCCRVADAAEAVRHLHPDPLWRREAQVAHQRMVTFMSALNTDPIIYNCLDGLAKSPPGCLRSDQRRMVTTLLSDMHESGAGLSPEHRHGLAHLSGLISALETRFFSNLLSPSEIFQVPAQYLPSSSNDDPVTVTAANAEYIQGACNDASVRRGLFLHLNRQAPANLPVLDDLVTARLRYARTLGYASYADLKLSSLMMGNAEKVDNFLDEFSARIRPKAQAEVRALKAVRTPSSDAPVDAWDVPFYAAKVRQTIGMDSAPALTIPLDSAMDAFATLAARLFGLRVGCRRMDSVGGVRQLIVVDAGAEHIGTLYLDLGSRTGKLASAAQFTLQNASPGTVASAVIACSFEDGERLRHDQCATLFHELGHALHLFLSKSAFSHLAGTRGPADFVEIASHVLEHFIWDPRIISLLSGVDQAAATRFLAQARRRRRLFAGIETQTQLAYAVMDQRLFGPENAAERFDSTTALWAAVQNERTAFAYVEGTHTHTTVAHFCSYGASYYSYLYARMLASHIWRHFFLRDPLASHAGQRFRDRFLAPGCTRDPKDILNALLDGFPSPSLDAFIRSEFEQ